MTSYERPKITDYGTLLKLTQGSDFGNKDVPWGENRAFPPS